MTVEYFGQVRARSAAELYRNLAARTGIPVNDIIRLADANQLAALYDPATGLLVYRGSDPRLRRSNFEARAQARMRRPTCAACGCVHLRPGDRCVDDCGVTISPPEPEHYPRIDVVGAVYEPIRIRLDDPYEPSG